MKARIISTGEIINIAEYARVTLDKCDDYGNPIEVPFEDIELIKDSSSNINWQQVRIQAAIAAMQGLCNSCHDNCILEIMERTDERRSLTISHLSIVLADALVKKLKGE